MKSRFDVKENFVSRLEPLIRRQIELYRKDPEGYVRGLPDRMHSHFVETSPSKKISDACLLAASLIATHREPTAEYIWRLMHENDRHKPSDEPTWQPQDDPGLIPISELKASLRGPQDGRTSPSAAVDDDIPF
jgi:hypothetical protein